MKGEVIIKTPRAAGNGAVVQVPKHWMDEGSLIRCENIGRPGDLSGEQQAGHRIILSLKKLLAQREKMVSISTADERKRNLAVQRGLKLALVAIRVELGEIDGEALLKEMELEKMGMRFKG